MVGQVCLVGVRVEQPKRAGLPDFHHDNTNIVGATALRLIRGTFRYSGAGLSALKIQQARRRENDRDGRGDRDGRDGRHSRHNQKPGIQNLRQKGGLLISMFNSAYNCKRKNCRVVSPVKQ